MVMVPVTIAPATSLGLLTKSVRTQLGNVLVKLAMLDLNANRAMLATSQHLQVLRFASNVLV